MKNINFEQRWKLENITSILTAELSAITIALTWLNHNKTKGKYVLFTDSKTSLHLISNRKIRSHEHNVAKIQCQMLEFIRQEWDVHLQWLPGHSNIPGNENADRLANIGRTCDNKHEVVELQDLFREINRISLDRWQSTWDLEKPFLKFGALKDKVENWHWTRHRVRKLDVIMTQLRLRCARLNKYLYKIKKVNSNICEACTEQEFESVSHYLIRCPAYYQQRKTLKESLEKLGIKELTTNVLLGSSDKDINIKKQITKILAIYITKTERF